jgi:hypothetical protein
MNDNAKKWVAALRSGKYKQGRKFLRYKDEYCCLGVACELAITDGLPVVRTNVPTSERSGGTINGGRMDVVGYDGKVGILPNSVRTWLGCEQMVVTTMMGQLLLI